MTNLNFWFMFRLFLRLSIFSIFLTKMFQTCVGWDMDAAEVMRAGERIWNLQRIYNLREGETRQDAIYPKRFLKEKLPEGPAKGMVLDKKKVDHMLDAYYAERGWDRKAGIPTQKKIKELGLEAEWAGFAADQK